MRTREISHEQWREFLQDFSQLHQGEQVNVETIGEGTVGVRSELSDVPLVEIVYVDSKARDGEWIEIIAGNSPGTAGTHGISNPSRVVIAEEGGQCVALQIDSDDGSITMLRFEPAVEVIPPGFTVA